jgi:hypothetical protein
MLKGYQDLTYLVQKGIEPKQGIAFVYHLPQQANPKEIQYLSNNS